MYYKSYKENLIKTFIYIASLIAFFLFIDIFNIDYIKELTGINLLLSLITVPCCILHYNSNKNPGFLIYILVYTSTCIESVFRWYLSTQNIFITDLTFTFMYRTLLLFLLLHTNCKYLKKCMEYSKIVFIISVLIDLIIIFFNYYVIKTNIFSLYFKPTFLLVTIVAFIIIFKLTIKTLNQKNFILTIYNISLILLGIRIIFIFLFNNLNISHKIIPEDKVLFFISLFVLLVGLFIQIQEILKVNRILNKDVLNISKNVKEIKELEEMRNYFFANLSHEIKTPLNMISSTIQLLQLNKTKSCEDFLNTYLKYEKILIQNTYRMTRLTNNFVDLSKIDAGFLNLDFKNYNIIELIENITMSVVFYVESKKLNIIFDTTEEEVYIKCDSDAMERIMLNLLSNSIKFTQENGNILVDMSFDSDFVYIKVKDDGCGIDDNLKDHVFDMFVQGDKSLKRANEGSGIGLSLVYSLVKLHDGDISISDTEIGTEIIVKLPNAIAPEEEIYDLHDIEMNKSSKGLIEKIDIEFSDIYDLN